MLTATVGWLPVPGQTLLVPSGPSGLHLFFVVLGPVVLPNYGSQPQLMMVGATTVRPGIPYDPACELQPGDHPFIHSPSCVAYRYMRLDGSPHVEQMVAKAVWTVNEPCSPLLLGRIVAGVCASRLAAREFKMLFGCP